MVASDRVTRNGTGLLRNSQEKRSNRRSCISHINAVSQKKRTDSEAGTAPRMKSGNPSVSAGPDLLILKVWAPGRALVRRGAAQGHTDAFQKKLFSETAFNELAPEKGGGGNSNFKFRIHVV